MLVDHVAVTSSGACGAARRASGPQISCAEVFGARSGPRGGWRSFISVEALWMLLVFSTRIVWILERVVCWESALREVRVVFIFEIAKRVGR